MAAAKRFDGASPEEAVRDLAIPAQEPGSGAQPPDQCIGHVSHLLLRSTVDGPGNRAVVFVQGCNFRCLYCHNPHTINHCNACGRCVEHCPNDALRLIGDYLTWDEERCTRCDACIAACPHHSSPRVRPVNPQQLWRQIEPYADYLSGVTVTGGEPTLQMGFLTAFLATVKDLSNLTTFIETNGCVSAEDVRRLLPVLDGAMVDLKAMDPQVHYRLTGWGNDQTKMTIRLLASERKLYEVRVVVAPGYSDSLENALATARFITGIDPAIRLRFLRFRPHGTRGVVTDWESPPDELMDRLVDAARAEGVVNVSRSM